MNTIKLTHTYNVENDRYTYLTTTKSQEEVHQVINYIESLVFNIEKSYCIDQEEIKYLLINYFDGFAELQENNDNEVFEIDHHYSERNYQMNHNKEKEIIEEIKVFILHEYE